MKKVVLLRKYCFSFEFCPNYPPPFPQFGNLYNFFPKSKDLKDSLELKIWAGPPSLGQNPKEQQYFLRRTSLRLELQKQIASDCLSGDIENCP